MTDSVSSAVKEKLKQLAEFDQQRAKLFADIESDKSKAIAEIANAAKAQVEELGFPIGDLIDALSGGVRVRARRTAPADSGRSVVAPKYQHPTNPSVTWSGRGKHPRWVNDALAGGASMASLLINK